jgi:uncharacterized membrane protein (DUF106 family)
MGFTSFLDPVLNWLLYLPPFLAVLIMALLVTFLVTIVYKYTTDQVKMKQLKEELKGYQDKIRQLAKENKPDKALALQNQAMKSNLEYMKHSFKATLWTMIPVLILFAWMSQSMAYYPIAPGQAFTVTAIFAEGHAPNATLSTIPDLTFISTATQGIAYNANLKKDTALWNLSGGAGEYKLSVNYNNENYDHKILITESKKYDTPELIVQNSKLQKLVVGYKPVYAFTLFGINFTWFWTYLILSIVLSMGIRKVMKVY